MPTDTNPLAFEIPKENLLNSLNPKRDAPTVSSRRKSARYMEILLAHVAELPEGELKEAVKSGYLALGGSRRKLSPAGPASLKIPGMGGPGAKPAGDASGNKDGTGDPNKAEFSGVIAQLLGERPDLSELLIPVARLAIPVPARTNKMRAIMNSNPPKPPAPATNTEQKPPQT